MKKLLQMKKVDLFEVKPSRSLVVSLCFCKTIKNIVSDFCFNNTRGYACKQKRANSLIPNFNQIYNNCWIPNVYALSCLIKRHKIRRPKGNLMQEQVF